jgi:hypothetical protein
VFDGNKIQYIERMMFKIYILGHRPTILDPSETKINENSLFLLCYNIRDDLSVEIHLFSRVRLRDLHEMNT